MSDSADKTKPAQRRKLGRGLGALMGEARREEPLVASSDGVGTAGERPGETQSDLKTIAVAAIEPHPEQPRRHFDEDALAELSASIAARGVIQPVIVRPLSGDRYQLVAGERRWRAAQKARLHTIPAIVRDLEERDVMALALIENIQREDLNPIEEAQAYQRLAEYEELTQADIAKLVDKSRSHVANLQRLLSLPQEVIDHVAAGRLSMGHARALVGHEDAIRLAAAAIDGGLNVREMEKLARSGKPGRAKKPGAAASAEENADILAVQQHLEDFLGLSVKIAADADPRSGAVTIRYRTLDQLDLVCQRLTGESV